MTDLNGTNSPLSQGDPIGPGFFRSFTRAYGSKRRRQLLLLAVVSVVIVVVLGVGLAVFSSMSRQSQSYKDGFSAGGPVYASDSTAQLGARQACKASEEISPQFGGLPAGANAAQWLKGCVSAFESAQDGS
jgi:hypothetical protein